MAFTRRDLLAATAAATVGTAGCSDRLADGPDEQSTVTPVGTRTDRPADCPTTQGLDVQWPTDLDAATAESFVVAYEHAYVREEVIEYEPDSRLDEYAISTDVRQGAEPIDDGYEVRVTSNGAVWEPTLRLEAASARPPEDADVVPVASVDPSLIRTVLRTAAREGEGEANLDRSRERIDKYVDHLASLSADFEPLEARGDSDSAFFDVDGTAVELTASATRFHLDFGTNAAYYVDESVVRRLGTFEGGDPRDGALLECREGE